MKLVLVYNADSGFFNALADSAHKLFSPSTYNCRLCKLTFGLRRMTQAWKTFLDSLGAELVFLHRDEWLKTHGAQTDPLPAIFRDETGRLVPVLSAEEINTCQTLDQLIAALGKKLAS
jgi:hypothetical protein